jgi:hypothetical protein
MKVFLSGLAKFFAVLFSIAFVISAIGAIFVINIEIRLLNPDTYKHALATQEIYTRLPGIIVEQLLGSINYDPCKANPFTCSEISPEFIACASAALGEPRFGILIGDAEQYTTGDAKLLRSCLDQYGSDFGNKQAIQNPAGELTSTLRTMGSTQLEAILSQLLPPLELKTLSENTLTDVFAYLKGQRDTAGISLINLKHHLSGPEGDEIILGIIRSQPECTPEQILTMTEDLLNNQVVTLCKLPDLILNPLTSIIEDNLGTLTRQIPDQVILLSPTTGLDPALPGNGLVSSFHSILLFLHLFPLLPLFFLILISLFVVRSFKNWFRWWGVLFLITALLSLVSAITLFGLFDQAWISFLVPKFPPILSAGVISLVYDLTKTILKSYVGGINLISSILGVIGLGMWIGSMLFNRKTKLERPNP